MDFEEHAAKSLLKNFGIAVPEAQLAASPAEAEAAAMKLGACVVKAQAPTGGRGKAGGVRMAASPAEARAHAEAMIGMTIGGYRIEKLLIEQQAMIEQELYAAITNDHSSKGPMLLISSKGGVDVEELAESNPDAVRRIPLSIMEGVSEAAVQAAIGGLDIAEFKHELAAMLQRLYQAYRELDAELIEINPLAVTADNHLVALDCKLTVDDNALQRQQNIVPLGAEEQLTALEAKAAAAGLKYIELGGSVGILANGAGLTMTTMDAIVHYGGTPANFLEIGGDAYGKAKVALTILLENPRLKSLLVNFCGAFARTDVMAAGVVKAWEEAQPDIPIFFTIHGTGEDEAVALVKDRLDIAAYDRMDDAVKAAIAAANARQAE